MPEDDVSGVLRGARHYVRAAGVVPGDEALLVASTDADPSVVGAVAEAARELGGTVVPAQGPPPPFYFQEPPPELVERMYRADVVLDVGVLFWGHSVPSIIARYDYGTKGGVLYPPALDTLTCPAAAFPLPLLQAILRRVIDACEQSDHTPMQITSPGGTDLTAKVWQSHGTAGGVAGPPGLFTIFPGAAFGFIPPLNVNGHAVFEAYTGFGATTQPVRFEIRDNLVEDISGGEESGTLRDRIRDIENGNFISEIMFGVNPKARVDLRVRPISLEAERSPLTLHLGMGDEKMSGAPRRVVSKRPETRILHQDGFMLYPTLRIGDTVIIERGHLTCLDAPDILALAATFGDPAELLTPLPIVR